MYRFVLIAALCAAGCLPQAAPWPPSDVADALDADADSDSDVDADADADADLDADDTAAPLGCNSLVFVEDQAYVSAGTNSIPGDEFYHDDQFTIELWAWFEAPVDSGTYTLVTLGDPEAWWLGMEDGILKFQSGEDVLQMTVAFDGWHHVGVVADRDGDELRMYLDGVRIDEPLQDPGAMVQPVENENLRFGRSSEPGRGGLSWPHSIDEVRFAHEVKLSGTAPDLSPERSVDGWLGVWRFDNDLDNAVTGDPAAGNGVVYSNSSPFSLPDDPYYGVCP
jgi:hypothetical protein